MLLDPISKPPPMRTEVSAAELLLAQKQSLEMVVRGASLRQVLEFLTQVVEAHAAGDAVAAILLHRDGRLYTGAAPSLPEDYNAAVDGLPAALGVGTCCHAVAAGHAVLTPDIAADPRWGQLKHLPLALGLTAAWSQPIVGSEGQVLGAFGTYFRERREPTRTERAFVEALAHTAALAIERDLAQTRRASQHELLDLAFDAAEMGAWRYDLVSNTCAFDARAQRLYNLPGDTLDHSAAGVASILHPDDMEPMWRAIERASDPDGDGRYETDYRVLQPDGGWRWLRAWGRAEFELRDGRRRAVRIVGASRDVTAQKTAERHRELLVDELNHRVKNTLSIVQSIAFQTQRAAPDPEKFNEAFTARIAALARTHSLLAENFWDGAHLAQVMTASLAPFCGREASAPIHWHGPDLRVDPSSAVTLSLLVHELATNAVKYGALSIRGGEVRIGWRRQSAKTELEWVESNGPPVQQPASRGFGSRLIEATARQLGAAIEHRFAPDGVVCRVSLPLAQA